MQRLLRRHSHRCMHQAWYRPSDGETWDHRSWDASTGLFRTRAGKGARALSLEHAAVKPTGKPAPNLQECVGIRAPNAAAKVADVAGMSWKDGLFVSVQQRCSYGAHDRLQLPPTPAYALREQGLCIAGTSSNDTVLSERGIMDYKVKRDVVHPALSHTQHSDY